MTLSELRKRPVFVVLTAKQQKFLEAYLSTGGDILESVLAAYGTTGDTAKRRARILVKTRYIYDLMVAINLEELSEEDVLREASVIARTSRSDLAKVKALSIVAQMSGYLSESPAEQRKRLAAERQKRLNEEARRMNSYADVASG
jgi:hypothetical protein